MFCFFLSAPPSVNKHRSSVSLFSRYEADKSQDPFSGEIKTKTVNMDSEG